LDGKLCHEGLARVSRATTSGAERPPNIAADLAELGRLRCYVIRRGRAHGADGEKLRSTIDDYVEQLTGDRTALHAKSSSIGPTKRG